MNASETQMQTHSRLPSRLQMHLWLKLTSKCDALHLTRTCHCVWISIAYTNTIFIQLTSNIPFPFPPLAYKDHSSHHISLHPFDGRFPIALHPHSCNNIIALDSCSMYLGCKIHQHACRILLTYSAYGNASSKHFRKVLESSDLCSLLMGKRFKQNECIEYISAYARCLLVRVWKHNTMSAYAR